MCGLAIGASALALQARPGHAILTAPAGSRLHQDRLDGYYFFYPDTWSPVTTSGNDVFYRNPYNVNENLFVDISSPSSSRYGDVAALGSPEAAAQRTLAQFLEELMSTRLGVRREGEVVSATARTADDGKLYYDVEVRVRSYASRNQLAADPRDRAEQLLEWDRRYVTVLGVANQRLYSFRLQTANDTYDRAQESLLQIAHSFRCKDVVA
ncbi:hypothetical protein WJX81_006439 [Elliptochloris bilobata]|uniref:PsbP C-terminal domain-containing protein n=1 Tax=Elliptochloris bilobata TaxID=381761 RepID=A0AAW1RM14_9CHLO